MRYEISFAALLSNENTYNSDILENIWDKAYEYTSIGKSSILPRKNVYRACARHGIGLVGMKPFAGGFVLGVEKDAGFTPVNLVFYVLAQEGVSTAVPGCENPQQIEDILTFYTGSDEARDYSEAISKSRWSVKGNCIYCNHCMPCPANINIAQINKLLNSLDNDKSDVNIVFNEYSSLGVKASSCIQCGAFESHCPFDLPVIERMEKAQKVFELS